MHISGSIKFVVLRKTIFLFINFSKELYVKQCSVVAWVYISEADPGGGGGAPDAPPPPPPPKIRRNTIFWRKIVIFHTKYPKNVCASLHPAQFF